MDPDDGAGDNSGDHHHNHPLVNLSNIQSRMTQIHNLLTKSLNTNTILPNSQTNLISTQLTTAINQLITNATTLITTPTPTPLTPLTIFPSNLDIFPKPESSVFTNPETAFETDWDIVELDAVELLAEHLHFCQFCGKGFKRDANLRMHMRAHGNQFKTLEALSKPVEKGKSVNEIVANNNNKTRFSCPFNGCSRNKLHKKFRPLKSVICVKNHFKRSHCPKMYSCNRCNNKKSFSVLADLKSHSKHCGETKWKCSCGTSFSRKDKLFGHMALFEGHMPDVPQQAEVAVQATTSQVVVVDDDDDNNNDDDEVGDKNAGMIDDMFFDGLGSIDDDDDFCIQDLLRAASNDGFDWNM